MATENFGIQTEIFLKVSGKMIKRMGKGRINIKMELSILEIGKKIYKMVLVQKFESMEVNIVDCIKKEKSMEKACMSGQINLLIMVNGTGIKLVVHLGYILGQMGESIQALGLIIICTVLVFIVEKMEENMKVYIIMTKSMVLGFINELMEGDMRVLGNMENSMEKGDILCLTVQ